MGRRVFQRSLKEAWEKSLHAIWESVGHSVPIWYCPMDTVKRFWKLVKSTRVKDNAVLTKNLKISHPRGPTLQKKVGEAS